MKNIHGRFVIIALVTIIVFLYAITIKAHAAGVPDDLQEVVSGTVKDKAGMPLPGVTVAVKGANRGTVTNLDGAYEISVGPQAVLVFSFMGYKTVEVPVKARQEIDVQLSEDIQALNEVEINAGYYNTTRRESTGNISRVTAEEIELQPVVSPLQALQGRMAGVEIIPGGGFPGMAPTVRIRGINSLREEGNYPLYIVDGVPVNSVPMESNSALGNPGPGIDPLNFLNLSNIKSIEVLKDADATAIYGSRGANGVVLITTKKGGYGRTGWNVQVYTGVATVPGRIDMLSTKDYLLLRSKAFENDGVEPTAGNAYDLVLWDQEAYTDWQDFFFGGSSSITDLNISTSGGDENTSFRLGGSFSKRGTVFPADFSYRKITGNFGLNHVSEDKKLSLNFAVNYGVDIHDLVGNMNISSAAFTLPPNAPPVFLADGNLNWEDWTAAGLENPLEGLYNDSQTLANNLISSLSISYELLQGLRLKSNFGYTSFISSEVVKRPRKSYNPANWNNLENSSSHLEVSRRSWIVEPQLEYQEESGKAGIEALVGGTFQENIYQTLGLQGRGYIAESLIGNLGAAEQLINAVDHNIVYRYSAVFGRLGFNWDERYFLNLTGRRDGSSRFGPGKQFANFWAVGGAWIFTEEDAFEEFAPFWSFGKIRASYGTTGNDQIGDYGFLDAYEVTPGPGGLYPIQLANPDYSWEVNRKMELGIALGFLEHHIGLEVNWYRNRSSNQLVGYPLPSITGFTTVQANLPATVENRGLEIELSTKNFQSRNFEWQTFLNISIPRNELISYPSLEQSSYANVYRVGHPLNISLLYEYDGLDPETGFYTVTDANDDGRLDYDDRTVIQDWGRDFFGGFSNNMRYKNFSIRFLWEFVQQEGSMALFNAGQLGMQRGELIEALGETSAIQRVSASPQASIAYSRALNTELAVVDASFIRLKTLSVTYFFPNRFIEQTNLERAKIFLNGQNLYTLTDYNGIDPEMPQRGVSFAGLRTITAGVQLQF